MAHPLAEIDKGSGILMCCTFGDLTDVIWWRELQLPTRSVITRQGRIQAETPEWIAGGPGAELFGELAGKTVHSARELVVAALRESGDLDGEPKATQRKANFYERGEKPLEIVTSRQWYIRNGGRDADAQRASSSARARVDRLPPRVHAGRATRTGSPASTATGSSRASASSAWRSPSGTRSTPRASRCGTSRSCRPRRRCRSTPSAQAPEGYEESQRGQAGGFIGDPDVLDTWATSSLSPQIAGGWRRVDESGAVTTDPVFDKVFPMDVRPQGHDIIRTWLFATVVRAYYEHGTVPWTNAAISGWILDPDRKKMSKSKGNVVTPEDVLREHSADAVRYWAASGRLGADAAYDVGQMKVGRRLAIKVLNASKFALVVRRGRGRPGPPPSPTRSTGRCSPGCATSSRRPPPGSSRGTTPARSRPPRRSSGPSATTTSSSSRTAPTAPRVTPRRRRPGPRCASRSTSSCGCSRRSSPTSPKRCGRGGTRARSTSRRGRRPTRSLSPASPWTRRCSAPWVPRWQRCARASPRPSCRCVPRSPASSSADPRRCSTHVRAGEQDLRSAGKITGTLDLVAADTWGATDVELIPVEKPKPQS